MIKTVTGPGDLPHGRDRHRLARQPRARGRARAAGARLLLLDDGHRARAGPARGEHLRARARASTASRAESAREAAKESIAEAGDTAPGCVGFITDDLLPTSFVSPFVENEILRILVLAILVAASISMLAERQRKPIVSVFEVASKVVFGVIRLIMWAAPLGAFGGMAYTVSVFGADSLTNLGAADGRLLGHVRVLRRRGARRGRAGRRVLDLPDGPADPRRAADHRRHLVVGDRAAAPAGQDCQAAGASKQVIGMVIPTGYSFNLDGTCIYLTLGALFIVQATGQDMAIGEQIALAGLMVLTSKGAAGITGAGLVTLTASLQAFGGTFFSAESIAVGIALVVGIDRIMSEGRALTNAIGNTVATMVIAKWQGERDEEHFHEVLREPGDGRPRGRGRDARRGRRRARRALRPRASWWCLRRDA